jgi:ankyrin repeat protein
MNLLKMNNLYSQERNTTPLLFATQKKDLRTMTMLIKFDADINKVNWKSGESALHAACERR